MTFPKIDDSEALPNEEDPNAEAPDPKEAVDGAEEVDPKPNNALVSVVILPAFATSAEFEWENRCELSCRCYLRTEEKTGNFLVFDAGV